MDEPDRSPPTHIEETINSILQLRVDHEDSATWHQRSIDHFIAHFGHPRFISVMSVAILGWISINIFAEALGYRAFDPPPFAWLSVVISALSLYMVVIILGAQRHDDRLAEHRDMLMLELAILGEQKIAKVIQLLEEIRRDNPHIQDRVDHEAEEMALPANPRTVLKTIKEELMPATGNATV